MALVTYVLLAALQSGLNSRFHPEILGVTASKALGVVLVEDDKDVDPATAPYKPIVKLPHLKRIVLRGLIEDSALADNEVRATFANQWCRMIKVRAKAGMGRMKVGIEKCGKTYTEEDVARFRECADVEWDGEVRVLRG